MNTIYLQRHTRPDIAPKICYGVSDIGLAGSYAAEDLPIVLERLRRIKFDHIYSSPLTRCRLLAEDIARELGLGEITYDPRLKELNFGDWELMPWDNLYEIEEGRAWFDDYVNRRTANGESFVDMVARARAFLDDMREVEGCILVVTHSGFIAAAGAAEGQMELNEAFNHQTEYGGLVRLR